MTIFSKLDHCIAVKDTVLQKSLDYKKVSQKFNKIASNFWYSKKAQS